MSDFPKGEILVRYYSDNWGPYEFDFSDIIPSGDSLSTVNIRSFVGNVKPESDLTEFTEIAQDTDGLIDFQKVPTIANNVVSVYFHYPGSTYRGEKVTLVFEFTTANTGKHVAYFRYVKIQ